MAPPPIQNTISTGNLLTIAVMILSAGIAWGAVQADIEATNARLAALEAQVARAATDRQTALAGHETRLRTVEAGAARDGARLDTILQSLARIEARLDRQEGR